MGKARDAAGNIWETDAQGNATRLIQPAPGPFSNPQLPGQMASTAAQTIHTQAETARIGQQMATQPLQNESTRVGIEQNRQSMQNQRFNQNQGLRQEFNNLPIVKNYSTVIQKMSGALRAPDTPQGDLDVLYAFATVMDPNSVVRESEQDMAKNTASVVAQLRQKYNMISDGARLPDGVRQGLLEAARQNVAGINATYNQQRAYYSEIAKRNGFKPFEVVGPHLGETLRPVEEQYIKAHGGNPQDPNGLQARDAQDAIAFNDEQRPKALTPEQQAKDKAFISTNPTPEQYAAFLTALQGSSGPGDVANAKARLEGMKAGGLYNPGIAQDPRALALAKQYETQGGNPGAAALVGGIDAGTAGFSDELGGAGQAAVDYMRGKGSFGDLYGVNTDANRIYQDYLRKTYPGPYIGGQIAGGAAAGAGTAAGLARIPAFAGSAFGTSETTNPILGSVLSKEGLAGDTAYGGLYGAGSDNENRLRGGIFGAGLGLGGGGVARGAVSTTASAISPTGGKLRPLYDMGVRPSIGQRVGGPINSLEEKFQSIPLVGDAIAGTRDRARDQFQVGLFNDAMGQIGTKLPDGMGPGHAAHAFSQDAISDAYASALGGMTARADGELSTDLGALQRQVATLKPDSQRQFKTIWDDSVGRRFKLGGGSLSGDAYKDAESELSKKVAAIRSNQNGDGELADALEQATGALRGSAIRNSPPDAVAALNAADAAHARIVRIENASRSAGGDPAEFSPKQYNNAVRTSSGGVRNRNYLRGDALNSDIAALGTRLGDKVSNSGSIDRLAAGAGLTGLGYVNPTAAAGFAGYGALNAPGVRNVVMDLMAPRASPFFDRAADQLRQRSRLAGMFGAPIALDYFGGQ